MASSSSECILVVLTRRLLYINSLVTHVTVNLSEPRPVLHTQPGLQACAVLCKFPDCRINPGSSPKQRIPTAAPAGTSNYTICVALPVSNSKHPLFLTVGMMNRVVVLKEKSYKSLYYRNGVTLSTDEVMLHNLRFPASTGIYDCLYYSLFLYSVSSNKQILNEALGNQCRPHLLVQTASR